MSTLFNADCKRTAVSVQQAYRFDRFETQNLAVNLGICSTQVRDDELWWQEPADASSDADQSDDSNAEDW